VNVLKLKNGPRSPAAAWLLDNHSELQFQIRETRRVDCLRRSSSRLPLLKEGQPQLRIYSIASAICRRLKTRSWTLMR